MIRLQLFRGLLWAALLPLGLACAQPPAQVNQAQAAPAVQATAPAAPEAHPRKPAQVMGHEGAGWLEREGRDKEEKPEVVLEAMDLKPGQTVAEIGAGTGYFSRRIAKIVGPAGKVLAVDVQPEMLEMLKEYAAREGVTGI